MAVPRAGRAANRFTAVACDAYPNPLQSRHGHHSMTCRGLGSTAPGWGCRPKATTRPIGRMHVCARSARSGGPLGGSTPPGDLGPAWRGRCLASGARRPGQRRSRPHALKRWSPMIIHAPPRRRSHAGGPSRDQCRLFWPGVGDPIPLPAKMATDTHAHFALCTLSHGPWIGAMSAHCNHLHWLYTQARPPAQDGLRCQARLLDLPSRARGLALVSSGATTTPHGRCRRSTCSRGARGRASEAILADRWGA